MKKDLNFRFLGYALNFANFENDEINNRFKYLGCRVMTYKHIHLGIGYHENVQKHTRGKRGPKSINIEHIYFLNS